MATSLRVSQAVQESLCCPICHEKLRYDGTQFVCLNAQCRTSFPVADGIPILLNERASLFTIADYVSHTKPRFDFVQSSIRRTLRQIMLPISKNMAAKKNYRRLANLLLQQATRPRILVLGGSILGQGMKWLAENPDVELVETDIIVGPRTTILCDAHDIPFQDESFDGVIVQAVLEHVVDPFRCVDEIHRVLKKRGVVYAETPFMQQVHGREYDFLRFTPLGHRRLFRRFDEIDRGIAYGPGTALAWAYEFFLLSFTASRPLRMLIKIFVRLTAFYWKYFDYYLVHKPGALDAASCSYFLGRKAEHTLPDKELIKLYKGGQ